MTGRVTGRFRVALPTKLTSSTLRQVIRGVSFKAKFNVHILRESLHCYGYVRRAVARRPLELAVVAKLQQRVDEARVEDRAGLS